MQIVIKINDEIYKKILNGKDGWSNYVHGLIRVGTPLPKGHGRLIDESQITKVYMQTTEEENINGVRIPSRIYIMDTNAPTIIEADRSDEE